MIEFRLVPTPGAKSEFLASLEPDMPMSSLKILPPKLTLEGYTRDDWASDYVTRWTSFQAVASSSGGGGSNSNSNSNKKLPDFIKYLRERKKSAFGRFIDVNNRETYVIVIPSKQASSQMAKCRFAKLESIPKCPLKNMGEVQQRQQPELVVPPEPVSAAPSSAAPKRKGGLLGNLVGAQKRTNQHLQVSRAPTAAAATATTTTTTTEGSASIQLKSSGQVLAEFRQELEQKMLDFDISSEPVLKVALNVSKQLKHVVPDERENGRITMKILKYLVYEAAEEVNEEWIAAEEPSEFLDEITIAVYKEGQAPPEVLEDMNKAELPDEVRGQQQALLQQQQRQEQQRAFKNVEQQQKAALRMEADDEDFAALNQNKRDRRTIEDFQKANKRS